MTYASRRKKCGYLLAPFTLAFQLLRELFIGVGRFFLTQSVREDRITVSKVRDVMQSSKIQNSREGFAKGETYKKTILNDGEQVLLLQPAQLHLLVIL